MPRMMNDPKEIRLTVGSEGNMKNVVFNGMKLGEINTEKCVLYGKEYQKAAMSLYMADREWGEDLVIHFRCDNEAFLVADEIVYDAEYKDESVHGLQEISLDDYDRENELTD